MPGEAFCCQCSTAAHKCIACKCVQERRHCTNCRRKNDCRNRQRKGQNRENERGDPEDGTQQEDEGEGREGEVNAEVPNVAPILPTQTVQQDGDRQHPQQNEPQPVRRTDTDGRRNSFWKNLREEEASRWVDSTYNEIVGWPVNNLFEPPKCTATANIASEMTTLIYSYTQDTPLAPHALKILFILPKLFFQKTHKKAKPRENIKAVQRRMELWQTNKLDELLEEARALRKRLPRTILSKREQEDKARSFANKMHQGNVSSALRILNDELTGGVLPLNEDTIKELQKTHPQPSNSNGLRLPGEQQAPNPVIYERINGELIWKKALQTHGSSGPSGLDAKGLRLMLSRTHCGNAASDLCNALAALAKKLAATHCHHTDAYIACRLVPVDKKPGCRPIGIGEILRRVIGKCVMAVVKEDVMKAAGNLQVCAGQQAGGEAAIHAMREIYSENECEAVLLVDAENAFNTINRKTMLHNIGIKCPSLARYAENTYKEPSNLYITDSNSDHSVKIVKSMEGTTQGDPIAMAMYALGLSVLQEKTSHQETHVKQVAFADDLTGAGKISDLRKWWDLLMIHGPEIGYKPKAKKSYLIVKPNLYNLAKRTFRGSGVTITNKGQRHLGAVIGTEEFKKEYIEKKVAEWVKEVNVLSDIAKTEPHAAYTAFTHGLQHRWNFVMRTVPGISPLLVPLENAIRYTFLPELLKSRAIGENERNLLALPPRMGGMGITSPVKKAQEENVNSINLTRPLTEKIIAQNAHGDIDLNITMEQKKKISRDRQRVQSQTLENIKENVDADLQRKILTAQETGASNWLTSLPIRAKGFSLNKQEFVDAIALRYGWPVEGLPITCPCGLPNDVTHSMICKKGGFVCNRHDETRDLTASLLREVCNDVTTEPMLLPLQGEHLRYRTANTANEARVDISARGFWTRGQKAFVDIRIFDPMAACHRSTTLETAHKRNEQEKIRAYGERIQHVDQGSFTPLVFTTSGGMGPLAKSFYSRLAEVTAEKKHQPRSYVVAWMRCRLSFSLLRSALLCLRGTRYSAPSNTDVVGLDYEAVVVESGMRVDRTEW